MIFQTLDNDIDKISAKLEILEKSLDNITSSMGKSEINIPDLMAYSGMSFGDTSGNMWSKLFPGKEDIQSQVTDKNTFNMPIDDAGLQSIINDLIDMDKLVASGTKTWHEYHNELDKGLKWKAEYGQKTQGQIRSLEDVKNAQNAARNAAIAHSEGLNQMTIGAKVGQIALKGLSLAGNMVAFALLSKGIEFAVTGISNWIHRVENANEAMDEAVDAYESARSALADVNAELDQHNQRMDELLAKDKLSYVEQGELEKLQDITKELLLQKDIEEKRVAQASKEAAEKAMEAYNTQYGSYEMTEEDLHRSIQANEERGEGYVAVDKNDVNGNIAAYLKSMELMAEAQEQYDNALQNNEDTSYWKQEVQSYADISEYFLDIIDTNIADLQEKKMALETEYASAISKRDSGTDPLSTSEQEIIKTYESIDEAIRLSYKHARPDDWNQIELERLLHTDVFEKSKEDLTAMAQAKTLTPEAIESHIPLNQALAASELFLEDGQTAAEVFCNKLYQCVEAEEALENATEEFQPPAFTSPLSDLQDFTDGLEQLSRIYEDVQNQEGFDFSSILDNESFTEAFGGLGESYEDFIKTITNHSDDIEACQEAFDNLATSYLNNQDVLHNLTEENKDAAIAMLEQSGIANAEEIVTAQLARQKAILAAEEEFLAAKSQNAAITSENLTNATYDEITALLNEGIASDTTQKYLNQLLLTKLDLANQKLNNMDDVDAIIGIANAAIESEGYVNSLKTALTNLMTAQANVANAKQLVASSTDPLGSAGAKGALVGAQSVQDMYAQRVQNIINDSLAQVKNVKIDPTQFYGGSSGSSQKEIPRSYGGSGSSAGSTPSSSFTAPERDTTKTYDWIEKALTRIRESYDRLSKTADSVYRTFTKRNESLTQEFTHLGEQIDLNQKAYNEYMAKADAVGLSDHYKSLVQKGTISMEDITEEALQSQIDSYQEYYENAMKCSDAVLELKESLADLRKEKFDLISGDYNSQLALLKKEAALIDAHISRTEEDGLMVSTEYYNSLIENETENLKTLQANRDALKASLSEALEAGEIDLDSQAFRDMQEELLGVEEAIISSNESLIEFQNTIRELNWEAFDYLQESISRITEESDFLIELLSAADLFDESGNFSKEGLAALGLHGVNYNTFLYEAEKYAEELSNLEASLASDPYDTELIARRQELLDAQRDMIKAAEDEKQAMADLVREGIQIQLDALQELIDKRMDALKAEKDLYDYQKRIAQHTETIGAMEKQMEAYRGDTSEETRAKIQKLQLSLKEARTDLQETEYDKYISDQEQLLDDLYLRYEEILNMRLDNMDALIADLISQVNSSASDIAATLEETAKNAGSNLSNEMSSIWNTNTESIKDVITTNSSGFTEKLTTLSSTIDTIKSTLEKMLEQSNKEASDSLAQTDAATDTPAPAPAPAPAPTPAPAPAPAPDTAASGGGPSWGDWFVSKHDSYPKGKLNIDTSIVDRLKYHDIDPSFAMRKQYYSAMGGGGTYTGSASQNLWMIQQMKAHGFSQGGAIGSLIKASGEDGFILARSGEEVLSHKKLRDLKELLTPEKFQRFRENILASTPVPLSLQLPNCKKPAPVPNHLANTFSVDIGDINMYGVNDPKEFAAQLKSAICNNRSVHSLLQDVTLGEALGQNSLTKFGR